jgi:predicted metal-dependent hydrolase
MDAAETRIVELTTPRGRNVRVLARTHPRARHMRLTFDVEGPRISAPYGTPPAAIIGFLRRNAQWIDERLRERERQGVRTARPVPGVPDTLAWRGDWHLVRWEQQVFPRVRLEAGQVVIGMDLAHADADRIVFRAMRHFIATQMKREVDRIVREFEPALGRSVSSIRLMPLKTMWGSLTADGRMTLDLALMLAPPFALDYVVAHEMCHLLVRNHGPRFWQRVEALYPRTDEARDWLAQSGHAAKAELARWTTPAGPDRR